MKSIFESWAKTHTLRRNFGNSFDLLVFVGCRGCFCSGFWGSVGKAVSWWVN